MVQFQQIYTLYIIIRYWLHYIKLRCVFWLWTSVSLYIYILYYPLNGRLFMYCLQLENILIIFLSCSFTIELPACVAIPYQNFLIRRKEIYRCTSDDPYNINTSQIWLIKTIILYYILHLYPYYPQLCHCIITMHCK